MVMTPTRLKKSEKNKVLADFTPDTGPYNIIQHLADNPRTPVSELNTICSVGNVSDVSLKYNSALRKHRLAIGCSQPPVCYINQYHMPSMMHEWSLCRLSDEEMKLPIKGPDRPKVEDKHFKKRQKIIIDRTKEGELLNSAIRATRNYGLSSRASV